MKTVSLALLILLLAGCVASQFSAPVAERRQKYLAELPQVRTRPWGPCECTYHFLAESGAAGVPAVLQALDSYAGKTNGSLRALIVDGAWHYSNGTNTVVVPIMDRAARDPDPAVRAVAQRWLDARREKK